MPPGRRGKPGARLAVALEPLGDVIEAMNGAERDPIQLTGEALGTRVRLEREHGRIRARQPPRSRMGAQRGEHVRRRPPRLEPEACPRAREQSVAHEFGGDHADAADVRKDQWGGRRVAVHGSSPTVHTTHSATTSPPRRECARRASPKRTSSTITRSPMTAR